jgi:hypothetical protein
VACTSATRPPATTADELTGQTTKSLHIPSHVK